MSSRATTPTTTPASAPVVVPITTSHLPAGAQESERDSSVALSGAVQSTEAEAAASQGGVSLEKSNAPVTSPDAMDLDVHGEGTSSVDLDIGRYCAWTDPTLSHEQKLAAWTAWNETYDKAGEQWRAAGKPACGECESKHPPPHMEVKTLNECRKAGRKLRSTEKVQRRKERRDAAQVGLGDQPSGGGASGEVKKPANERIPTCPHCGKSHYPGRRGERGCHAKLCPKCDFNHSPQEGCLAAQNRIRAAGIKISTPKPKQFTQASTALLDNVASMIVDGSLGALPVEHQRSFLSHVSAMVDQTEQSAQPSTPSHSSQSLRTKRKPDEDSGEDASKKKLRKDNNPYGRR